MPEADTRAGGNVNHVAVSIAFAAVLLAGGRSSRMGRDKAEIILPDDGRPLWRRQLEDVFRPLGPAEIFLSGPPRANLPADVRALPDAAPGLGPLSGIAAALGAANVPLIVVLAVDLPAMTADFLRERMLARCTPQRGAVGRWENAGGFFEPLAAVYPRTAGRLAAERLTAGGDRSLQGFVRASQAGGLIEAVPLTEPADRRWFVNWNAPGDLDPR